MPHTLCAPVRMPDGVRHAGRVLQDGLHQKYHFCLLACNGQEKQSRGQVKCQWLAAPAAKLEVW